MNYSGKKAIYVWQNTDWPNFRWDDTQVAPLLNSVQEHQARLLGMLSVLGFDMQKQTTLESMTEDVFPFIHLSEILSINENILNSNRGQLFQASISCNLAA